MSKSDGQAFEMEKGALRMEKVITAQQADEEKNEELRPVQTANSIQELPFSKARCVALVATIAAAPFLSVSYLRLGLWREPS